MNLSKTRLYLLLSLALVASAGKAYADYITIKTLGSYRNLVTVSECPVEVGQTYSVSGLKSCMMGKMGRRRGAFQPVTDVYLSGTYVRVKLTSISGVAGNGNLGTACPDDKEPDETGKCVVPPFVCSEHVGEDAPATNKAPSGAFQALMQYCDTSTMCEAVRQYGSSGGSLTKSFYYTGAECVGEYEDYAECDIYGGCETPPPEPEPAWEGCSIPYEGMDYICPQDTDGDGRPDAGAPFDTRAYCNHDESGKFGCVGGTYTQSEPITDPTGTISSPSGGGSITDPNTPPIDVETPPDVEEPPKAPEGSNEDITKAITNQNRDLNKLLTDLNRDNNQNFANLNRELDMLNQRQHQTRDAIIEQMQKDIDRHNSQKAVALAVGNELKTAINANTETTKGALNGVSRTLTEKSEDIINAIDQNRFHTSLAIEQEGNATQQAITQSGNATVGAINANTDAINQLAEHLGGQPCEPTPVNNYCENPHGLNSDHASTIYTQIHDTVNTAHETAKTGMFEEIQKQIDEPLIAPTETVVRDSFAELFAILDRSKTCSPLVFETPIKTVSVSCQTSEYIKIVLGLLMYAYTVTTLIDILLNGVTPNPAGKPSATRYA
ncbi:hypothetical protein [Vibrio nigripulchritudo]|uniref:hypothetical protein n=1 Tax=Vibrio nigripulchritudo TaxID=28173 RepID=UPI0005F9E350|nr:hypothetical protein [Vibrio nigripulchritudo]KJY76355.1 hypothetical protein TW74_14930 [Vibrio nigripulchritudo]